MRLINDAIGPIRDGRLGAHHTALDWLVTRGYWIFLGVSICYQRPAELAEEQVGKPSPPTAKG